MNRCISRKSGQRRVSRLLDIFLDSRSEKTRRAYLGDFKTLAGFLEVSTPALAISQLLSVDAGELNAIAIEYRTHLLRCSLSPATVNRRLASLRSVLKHARMVGINSSAIAVANIKIESYRDTRGPGRTGFLRLLKGLAARKDDKAVRDRAILHLLYDIALRRGEIVSLDREDYDSDQGRLHVLGKGRTQRIAITLPPQTIAALQSWVALRGQDPGPLFTNVDPAGKGKRHDRRLTGRSIYRMVKRLGRAQGLRVTPHGLRHAAITEALNLTGGDVRAVQRFSRHKDIRVLNVYDDCRKDLAGHVAKLVASG